MNTPVVLISGSGPNMQARIFPSMGEALRWLGEDSQNGERFAIIRNCLSYMSRT